MRIRVTVQNGQIVRRAFARLDPASRKQFRLQVRTSAIAIQREARFRVPVNTGRLRSSIRAKFYQNGLSAEIGPVMTGGTDVRYAPFVEFGTKPHAAPIQAIAEWVRLKNRGQRKEDRMNPWAIWWKIKRKGTKPKPYLFPAWEMEKPLFLMRIPKAMARAIEDAIKGPG